MAIRRLLFLDSLRLTAYRWQSGGPRIETTFNAEQSGFDAFAQYLHEHRSSLYYLIADVAEEGFQIEDIPYVQGGDRQELLTRKLAQFFYSTPLSLAMSLGRNKDGRRDEKVLFAGLTGYSQFDPWLRVLREAESQLAGIYSAPLVLAELIRKLAGKTEPVLLMSVTHAGLRQTFFDQGQLRFSRLTPMATSMIGEIATGCATETRKIYQYLAGQRLISRDLPLKTLVLAHPGHFGIIGDRCPSTAERQVQMVDLVSECKRAGLSEAPGDSRADLLILHLLAKRPPHDQFAPAAERRPFRLWQARLALNSAAIVAIAAGGVYGGSQLVSHFELATSNSMLKSEIAVGQRRYENMLQGLPPVPISLDNLRTLTDRYQALVARSPGPEPLLLHISHALDKSPKVELTGLEWWLSDRPDDSTAKGGDKAVRAMPTATGDSYAIVEMRAQLPLSMAGDHRSQLETVNAFAGTLRSRDIEVRVLTLPFETESGKSIRSSETNSVVDPPRFVLTMAQKL